MESNLKFNILDFPTKPEKDFLNIIYDLNQSNTPEVGSLDSVKHLKSLLSLS